MIIYGINPLLEALKSSVLPTRLYFQSGKNNKRLQQIRNAAQRADIPMEDVPNMQKYCGQQAVHQGVAGEFPEDFVMNMAMLPEDANRIVMFDGIEDPHNFGAAIRVCEVFGFHHAIYYKGDSSGLTSVAAKSSAGAIFHVNLYSANLSKAITTLKERGYAIYCLEAGGESDIYNIELPEKYCLVIGSEGKGVRHNIRHEADDMVKIPMHGRVNSLNVSCALSAALCQFAR